MFGCLLLSGSLALLGAEPTVTRCDLARALVGFERTLHRCPASDPKRPEVERRFDRATMAFFAGGLRATIRDLHGLTTELEESSPSARERAAVRRSLRATVEPRWATVGETVRFKIDVQSLYPVATSEARTMLVYFDGPMAGTLQIPKDAKATISARFERECTVEPRTLSVSVTGDLLLAGVHSIGLERPLPALQRELSARLEKLRFDDPARLDALAAVRSRCDELLRAPSENDTRHLFFEVERPDRQIAAEVAELEAGRDPFARRAGQYWRICTKGALKIPARFFAPATVAKSPDKLPLVVALHGAGGDENMFLQAYGQGRIGNIAEERGCLVVCPLTYGMTTAPALDAVIQAAALHYPVDEERIYLLGHSMGAGMAAALAKTGKAAAACCLAGGGAAGSQCPLLVCAGELDPLVPHARLETAAQSAREKGAQVEYKLYKGMGHTLMVAEALPAAFDFLLKHRRGQTAKDK